MNTLAIEKAIRGDEISFTTIIEEKKESLYRLAYSYVKNRHDALDIFQEAVYKAYISIHKLKKPETFNAWIKRIVVNTAIDYLRKTKKIVYIEKEYEASSDEMSHAEEVMDLKKALDELDPKSKTIITLRFFEDLPLKEIAEILEMPLSTVKTNLYRSLDKLKINLEEVDKHE